jgi:demethylmenaquinone methyltransferase/2-methoxy-6-polyprenyl-1,4-benzoquinol methylase
LVNKIPDNDSKLLEIAIGTGKNSILLAKNKPKINIIGIDLSDEMLKIAKNNIMKEKIKNIELMKMDGTNMTFRDETFDFITISLLFHELPEQVANKILSECIKKLKHNGKLYILEWEEPKKIIQKIMFLPIKIFEPKEYKIFMKKDLNAYFDKNGFQIKSIEYGNYSKVIELSKSTNST